MTANNPGYKTTEFWLTALASLLTVLNQSGVLGQPLPTDTILAVGQAVAVYVVSRSGIKAVKAFAAAKTKPVDGAKLNQ